MKLTEEQKEIALRVAAERGIYLNAHDDMIVKFAARFLAALPKPKPVAWQSTNNSLFITTSKSVVKGWESSGYEVRNLYAEAPIAPPASEQKPVAWATTNEDGDYAMLFFDQQEARSYSGDDEPIGLAPVSSSAPRPDYKAQRDAERLDFLEREYIKVDSFEMPTGGGDADVGWRLSQYHMGKPRERVLAEYYKDDLRAAIDAAIASVKGGE